MVVGGFCKRGLLKKKNSTSSQLYYFLRDLYITIFSLLSFVKFSPSVVCRDAWIFGDWMPRILFTEGGSERSPLRWRTEGSPLTFQEGHHKGDTRQPYMGGCKQIRGGGIYRASYRKQKENVGGELMLLKVKHMQDSKLETKLEHLDV